MNNRRNYYRILNVQPDASVEVIKANYRAIMQKMKLHPDLGGDQSSASLLNIAYDVLRNPNKRAKYDQSLLSQYHIKQLSQGHLNLNESSNSPRTENTDINTRNYYRVLHVQPDSPNAIIEASYKTLVKNTKDKATLRLLEDAKTVLLDKQKKQQYDKYLQRYDHLVAVKKLFQDNLKENTKQRGKQSVNSKKINKTYETSSASTSKKIPSTLNPVHSHYQPVITQYCFFCMTPHNQSPSVDIAPYCVECQSPLFPPSDQFINQDRRNLNRQNQDSNINVYYDWPASAHRQIMLDLSPTGMKTQTTDLLDSGQLVKIDADSFSAVGEVSYVQEVSTGYQCGIRFLTVQFKKQKGQFFSTKT